MCLLCALPAPLPTLLRASPVAPNPSTDPVPLLPARPKPLYLPTCSDVIRSTPQIEAATSDVSQSFS